MGGENRNRQKRPTLTPPPKSPRGRAVEGMKAFPRDFTGAFRDNIRLLLERHCERHGVLSDDDDGAALAAWRTTLVDEGTGQLVGLYFVEEQVELSPAPFCDYCRCAGWSHHLVSRRRYHIIIPSINEWIPSQLPAETFIHSQSHLLHGLLHCNGFGHLLSLHGRSSGTGNLLRGRDLMDLWDRLCQSLCVRSVSVEDISANSLLLPLRLLYSLSHGQPWFARWGYGFSHGCYGITKSTYSQAVDFLSALNVELFVDEIKDLSLVKDVTRIVAFYRQISGKPLYTIRELFAYLLEIRQMENYPPTAAAAPILSLPAPNSARQRRQAAAAAVSTYKRKRYQDFDKVAEKLDSRWPVRRLRFAAGIIVDALHEHGGTLTRQEVRDAARRAIGDTGLIDFVVKSIGDTVVAGRIVRRTPHPRTRVLQFSVDDEQTEEVKPLTWPSKATIGRDIDTLYRSVVKRYWQEAHVILDCKHWAKHWGIRDDIDDNLRFVVEWQPMPWEIAVLSGAPPPPPPPGEVVVVVEPHASVGDLVAVTERAMRDTYCVMERFKAHSMVGLSGEFWEPVMSGGAESGARIGIVGDGVDLNNPLRYERGEDVWMVECLCGAREDDGETMIACDVCAAWHHTRCVGMADDDRDTCSTFLCSRCAGTSFDDAAAEMMPLVPLLQA